MPLFRPDWAAGPDRRGPRPARRPARPPSRAVQATVSWTIKRPRAQQRFGYGFHQRGDEDMSPLGWKAEYACTAGMHAFIYGFPYTHNAKVPGLG